MRTPFALAVALLAVSGCASREQTAGRMAERYDIPTEAALFIGDRCPPNDLMFVARVNACRRVAARQWNEDHPDRVINTALDMDSGGGAMFFFVPVR